MRQPTSGAVLMILSLLLSCGSGGAQPGNDAGKTDGGGAPRDGGSGDTLGKDSGHEADSATDSGTGDAGDDRAAPAGTQLYVTQDGSGKMDGASCADAHPVTWFNDPTSWGGGATKIGPGTVVHLCGTFTGAAGTTLLITQGGGAAGNPVTLYFEPGAVLTAPYWRGDDNPGGGAIDASKASYFTVDGGESGIIECSANGTGLTYQEGTLAISMGSCSHCEVTNLTIRNLYIHTGTGCEVDQTEVQAISFQAGAAYDMVDNVVIHDVGWAISSNASHTTIGPNVEIYNIDHGFIFGTDNGTTISDILFHDNHVHDYANWDTTAATDCYHHDGIHGFGGATSAVVTDFAAYDNLFDGETGQNFNEHIFLEGTNDGTPWTTSPSSTSHIFNNVFSVSTNSIGIAGLGPVGGSGVWANNTLTGFSPSYVSTCEGFGNTSTSSPGAIVENNAVQNCGVLAGGTEMGPGETGTFTVKTFDYNAYASCNHTYNCFFIDVNATSIDTSSFSAWQSMSGYDTHSIADLASSTYFALDSTFHPTASSPLIGKGDNLTSLCTGSLAPLCKDKAGKPRPTTGAWDIGAFQN
jgi:hypothetical protein